MFAWMLYAITVSFLLTLAASCAAHSARLRAAPGRFIWAGALTLSLVVPAAISSVSVTLPRLSSTATLSQPRTFALRDLSPNLVAPSAMFGTLPASGAVSRMLDDALPVTWAALSVMLAAAWLVHAALLGWRRRGWTHATLAGTPVLVAPDAGPALAGLLFPKIVVPAWLLQEPDETVRTVIAHERAHLAAGDTYLLAAAVALLMIMPWNLPLWWQIRRLRFGIETDCDARIIAAGAPPARYAEILIDICEHGARSFAPAMAMAEPASHLEKRIRIMLENRRRNAAAAVLPVFAAALIAASAAAVTPPNAEAPADLARFTGTYQMGPTSVLTVTQKDGALLVRLTGQPALRVSPHGPAAFTADSVGAEFDFTLPDSGPATDVTLHQNGQVVAMARIDDAQAQRITATTNTRGARDTAAPGSRIALAHLVDGIIAASPDYTAMTPKLADVIRAQLATLHDGIGSLGAVESIDFVRVGTQGEDIYTVKQKQGATTWRIVLAADKVAGVWVQPST